LDPGAEAEDQKYHAFPRNNKTEDIEKHVEGIKDSEIQ